jgi:dGTPase
MSRTSSPALEGQCRTVLSVLHDYPDGLALNELKEKLPDPLDDLESVVLELVDRYAVTLNEAQKFVAAFAKPPYPPTYFEPRDERERRRHAEPRWLTDPRPLFVRDRERIVFSSAFRRLARVTQVFPAADVQLVHNRMSHSIKASHIGRSIAQRFRRPDVNADVVDAAALAHDIGHPPFGHAGEKELDDCMREWGGFEGNAQTFRVLTKLSRIRPEFPGLNLTGATLNGVIKYPWFRQPPQDEKRHHKWNAYSTEAADFQFARANFEGDVKSAEARVMELSDDIAYGVHDLEDGIRAGLIPLHELVTQTGKNYDEFIAYLKAMYLKASSGEKGGPFKRDQDLVLALGVLRLGGRTLGKPFDNDAEQRGMLRRLTTLLHQRYLLAVAEGDLALPRQMTQELTALKAVMPFFVFRKLGDSQEDQRKTLRVLFAYFLDKGLMNRTVFDRQTQDSLAQDERTISDSKQNVARAACDQIATMTEDEVIRRYQQITGVPPKNHIRAY